MLVLELRFQIYSTMFTHTGRGVSDPGQNGPRPCFFTHRKPNPATLTNMQNNTPPLQRVGVTTIGTPFSTKSRGASRQQSPSDSVSTLSVTTNAASSAGVSAAHRSIFGNTSRTSATNTTTSETTQQSQEEVIEESDEEDIYDYPGDSSSGSASPDFA